MGGAASSASVVVPLVVRLVRPESVLDVGCGRGAWLRCFGEHGVRRLVGMDGGYVEPGTLLIDPACFRAVDLNGPLREDERYDLALCLEVAEHLPARSAGPLVEFLTESAPLVLFSAAVPGQGGVGHINERWPAYWEGLFRRCEFVRLDPFRRHVFQDSRVEWWYQQNLFLFASGEAVRRSDALRAEAERAADTQAECVSRVVLDQLVAQTTTLRGALRRLSALAWAAVKRRAGWDG
jgi:hypothetical protein